MRPATKLGPDLDASHAPGLEAHARRLAGVVASDDPIEDAYPLSPVQEAMLFHTVGSDAADLYIVQQRLELDGPLDVESFRRAWALVIARHPALRSVFAWSHAGPPLQVVCRQVAVPVELIDLAGVEDPERAIEDAFAADRSTRFDLTMPPLMRLTLFRLEEHRHVLLWSQHHLLQDGWSSSVVLGEVFAAHEALWRGMDPALGPVRPFREFIDWLGREGDRDGETFWKQHLAGFSEPTRMGAERSAHRAAGTYARRFLAVTPELTADLRRFAREQRVSLNTVLVGGLAVVLSRYTGRADVAFGTVASGRPPALPGVESMVGMFINTLVLRLEVALDAPIGDWLPTVQARQAALFDHEHSALAEVQSWSELPPGTALTDVLFAYWNFGGAGTSPDGTLTYRTVDGYGRTSFPFSVTVEGSDPINLGVDFDAADVLPARAEQFLAHYATLLASMVADPKAPVAALPMLTLAERRSLDDFNATASPIPHATVLDAFAAQVAQTPDAVAAECDGTTITYADLDRRSKALAHRLRRASHGAVPRAAIFLERSIEMLVAVWGTLRAGGAYVPIDRHHPPERIGLLVADGQADVVLTSPDLAPLLAGLEVPTIELPPTADRSTGGGELPDVVPGDLAYVMFTSGSTGRPKGVMIEHRSLINYVWWAAQAYGNGEPTSFPFYSSVAFDLTVTSMFVPLVTGGRIVVYPDREARDLSVLDVFAEDKVDVVKLTPSHLAVLEPDHLATDTIRTLILGGEDLSSSLAAAAVSATDANLTIYNEYGPTEATVGCMIHRFDPATDVSGSVPIGRPAANTRIYLLDEGLSPVPMGSVGELYIAGDGVALGYLNRPELTAERFVPDPLLPDAVMYRSGDQARRNERGLLEYVGRSDEQVKVRGYRIEPGEIEAVLSRHPAVSGAAIAVRRPRPDDVRLVAYYVAAPGASANVTELRAHLAAHLPAYMVPSHLVRIDALPVTPNGKLDRAALPETIGESVTTAHHVAPRNDAEGLVADLAAALLGVERVSMADNFFDLGGHSVLAMQLIARLHDETGIRISPRVVLLNTLAQAAAQLPAGGGIETNATPVATTEAGRSMATSAFFFGPSQEALFGLRHIPAGERVRQQSVLICPPVGWEFMRTHRALRSLGRRLGLAGFTVLRFDYFATGDSFGSDGSGSMARWIGDVAAAAAELRAGGDGDLTVIGMRLGAALAVAAAGEDIGVGRLVLWDPVVNGAGHLAVLERMHAELLANRPEVNRDVLGDELLGFRYPASLRSELGALDLTALQWPEVPTTVLCSRTDPEFDTLASIAPTPPEVVVVEDAGAWDDLSSAQAALLPSAIPQRIVELLQEASS